ncbi:MAG: SagB/ThcOx family dehydrogenase [Acidobacteriaceae bacterium]|nr:SagB/ThcOx family dehydrogenase [Acidobacteriaceae bacterium]
MISTTWELLTTPLPEHDSPWELFHENSKLFSNDGILPAEVTAFYQKQILESLRFESYPEIKLPNPAALGSEPLQEALARNAVVTELEPITVPLDAAAALLHYSYGIMERRPDPDSARQRRAVHSENSSYPLELFVHNASIAGLERGLYHYYPPGNSLRLLRSGDQSQKIAAALIDGRVALSAALIVLISAVPERSVLRYRDRGYRFVHQEAGAVVRNLNLIAGSLRLSCVNTGEYFDPAIDDFLALDGLTASTIFIVAVGKAGAHERGGRQGRVAEVTTL